MLRDARLPHSNDSKLHNAMRTLDCPNAELVPIIVKPNTQINQCHANVALYVAMYGGKKITGYYVAVSKIEDKWIAIKHSVWKSPTANKFIDITPINDNRTANVFIWGNNTLYTDVYYSNGTINKN